jgi:four helix bundle protein
MFLKLTHKEYDVFKVSKELVLETYRITDSFPPKEKYGLTSQLQRASVSVILNISEGCSRKSIKNENDFMRWHGAPSLN